MKAYSLLGALSLWGLSAIAQATPIVYTFEGRLSGALAGNSFSLANVSFSFASDTDTVFQPTPTVRPTFYNTAPGILRFTVDGASGAFNPLYNAFSITIFNGDSIVGLTETGSNDLIDVVDPRLSGYDLQSSIGPITNSPLDFLNFDTSFQTSLGELILFDDDDASVTFSAATAAVPEPATWVLAIGGFGMVGGALRRKRRRPVRVAVAFA